MSELVIVPTGTANIASVEAAFRRLGAEPVPATGPIDVAKAERVVLPGVGSFGAAMSAIEQSGMRAALTERIRSGRPTLAVCVGMQLLCAVSDESPGAVGLGILPGSVGRFEGPVKVPQLGWNEVTPAPGSQYLKEGWAYFANSYRLEDAPPEWLASTADHGSRFVAAIERGSILALQFHPELSGEWGASVLSTWLERVAA
jgi:imidazole glycerol-phosphate synthase subunit HisH